MSDWFESLKAVVTERVSSPLIFAYAFAWPIINYQIVLMMFSDADALEKISFISAQYSDWQGQLYYLGWPLCVAVIYMLGMPWVSYVNLAYNFWQGKFTRSMKLNYEKATMISESERDELIARHREELDRLHTDLSKKSATYADLGRQNESLLQMHADAEARITSLTAKYAELESENSQLLEGGKIQEGALEDLKQTSRTDRLFRKDFDLMLPGLELIADNYNVVGAHENHDLATKARLFIKNVKSDRGGPASYVFE